MLKCNMEPSGLISSGQLHCASSLRNPPFCRILTLCDIGAIEFAGCCLIRFREIDGLDARAIQRLLKKWYH
jgi:hypothetical protein